MKKSLLALFIATCMIVSVFSEYDVYAQDESATADETENYLPSPDDPLTQVIGFEKAATVKLYYPETMYAAPLDSEAKAIMFISAHPELSDDPFASILVSLDKIEGYDEYMNKGRDTAKRAMEIMLEKIIDKHFAKDAIVKNEGADFFDFGKYWEVKGYLILDGSIFEAPEGQEVANHDYMSALINVRYYGPTGYVLTTITYALDKDIVNYYHISQKITDSATLDYKWTTESTIKPKKEPARNYSSSSNNKKSNKKSSNKKSNKSSKKSNKKSSSNSSKKKTTKKQNKKAPYNWVDSDGDLWHWNGQYNEFLAFAGYYSLDSNGNISATFDYRWGTDPDPKYVTIID